MKRLLTIALVFLVALTGCSGGTRPGVLQADLLVDSDDPIHSLDSVFPVKGCGPSTV